MTKKILTIAALALMMAACSNEDTVQQPAPAAADAKTMPFRAVISADNTPTRGLSEATDGKSITAKWEVGEQIALIHGKTIDVVEVKSVDAGFATLNGDITNYVANEAVYLVYVGTQSGAMDDFKTELLQTSSSSTAITVEMIKDYFNVMSQSQDGTLKTINEGLDYRLGTSTLTKTGNFVTLSTSPTLSSQFAIWKLLLTTDGTTAIAATQLDILDAVEGIASVNIDPSVVAATPGVVYVLLPASTITGTTYKFEATAGSDTYACSHSGINLTAGYFYRSTLTMVYKASLGDLFYSDGTFSPTLVAGKTPIGVIAYLGDDPYTETGTNVGGSTFTGHGLVLCLRNAASGVCWSTQASTLEFDGQQVTDISSLTRSTNVSGYTNTTTLATKQDAATKYPAAYQAKNYTGLTAPTGTTGWFLPSAQQWVKMVQALGGIDGSTDDLSIKWLDWFDNNHIGATAWETALAKAGSGNYDSMTSEYLWYWSSSEFSSSENPADRAFSLAVDAAGTGNWKGFGLPHFDKISTSSNIRVRPVLAF